MSEITAPPKRLLWAQNLGILPEGPWLDVCAGPGEYLKHMPAGSMGIDLRSIPELNIHEWNFDAQIPVELQRKFSVVWCSNVFEHVMDPHPFLLRLKKALNPNDGVLVVSCPQTLFDKHLWHGAYHGDHVNFFTIKTLVDTLKFAGLEILWSGCPSFPRIPPKIGKLLGPLSPTIQVIAKPIKDWSYPAKALKKLNSNGDFEWLDLGTHYERE
jgi:hypothetical protein